MKGEAGGAPVVRKGWKTGPFIQRNRSSKTTKDVKKQKYS